MRRLSLSGLSLGVVLFLSVSSYADTPSPAPDPWAVWQDNFRTVIDACTTAKSTGCLAKAFNDKPRPPANNPQGTVSGELFYDLHTAVSMLAVPNAANALWSAYGVDTVAYLGTGYSVPVTSAGVEHYWQAMQREYFVPNLCAQPVDPAICPTGDPDVWTWQLSVAEMTAALDKPITAIFTGNTRALTKRVRGPARADGLPNAFIRFGLLRPAWYKGTFGRPDAKLVFFADYTQVRTKTLREAMTATGAATLIANPDPGQVLFIWIYAPGPDTKAQAASWHAVFETLAATP